MSLHLPQSAPHRVPHVREVAVAGDVALIGGGAAWFLAYVLSERLPGGIESALEAMCVGPRGRDTIRRAYLALEEVGARWQAERSASARGNGEGPAAAAGLASDEWITSKQAALLLDRSPRRVRQLAIAGDLPGRLRAGRWELVRREVLGFRERRERERAAS